MKTQQTPDNPERPPVTVGQMIDAGLMTPAPTYSFEATPAQAPRKGEKKVPYVVNGRIVSATSYEEACRISPASHSPLPWNLSAFHPFKVVARSRGDATICDCSNPIFQDLREQEANAAFIVRACNNAQGLADALKDMVAGYTLGGLSGAQAAKAQAREALAQWEQDQ